MAEYQREMIVVLKVVGVGNSVRLIEAAARKSRPKKSPTTGVSVIGL